MAVPRSGIPAPDPAPQDATVDDLTAATLTVTGASTLATVTATSVSAPHSGLTGVTADQHHAQSHGHTGADGSGTVAHSATTGQTANDHHSQAHVVTGADHTASGLTAGHVLRATGATTFAFGALADADVPATIARDTEVTTAISDHAALADPHTVYQKESESANLLPWHISIIPVIWTADATTGTWAVTAASDVNLFFPFYSPGSSANSGRATELEGGAVQNDAIAWDVVLAAGTWDAHFWVRQSSNTGIITLNEDGASKGTVDTYAAAPAASKLSITGWTVATTGKKRMQILMATKNASSSAFVVGLFAIEFRRTA